MHTLPDLAEVAHVERVWAADAVEFAGVIAEHDPSWGSEWFEVAGGFVVLCGPGLYVNRALAVGLDRCLVPEEFTAIESRAALLGLPASVEVGPATHPDVATQLGDRGYVPGGPVASFSCDLATVPDSRSADGRMDQPAIAIERADGRLLSLWQETAAIGWGHDHGDARRASDAFARAAAVVDGAGFVVATSIDDGRPIACASLTIRDDVATLGGMSTIPAERGRGVQSALIRHRLGLARDAGCRLATSTAAPASTSARNLERHGLSPWFTKTTFTREL